MNFLKLFKTDVNKLDVGKLKTVPNDLKNVNDVVYKEIVVKTLYNALNTEVNNSEKSISDASTLIQINHYNR